MLGTEMATVLGMGMGMVEAIVKVIEVKIRSNGTFADFCRKCSEARRITSNSRVCVKQTISL